MIKRFPLVDIEHLHILGRTPARRDALIAAVPIAVIGAVTCVVRDRPALVMALEMGTEP